MKNRSYFYIGGMDQWHSEVVTGGERFRYHRTVPVKISSTINLASIIVRGPRADPMTCRGPGQTTMGGEPPPSWLMTPRAHAGLRQCHRRG
ncbi:hypothetical protein GWI33_002443 [Rhynchophorus ferrugineus]|uniref:Uncharacterized protein n=1 Tax=Rhynchophorus ferrugineus TaxID=354439 RepID=A0A834IVU6_RHYFE|nr:hypothetical protein GWI33_002443 [Rhynchophorus ferrugineus]